MMINMTLSEFLAETASNSPAPGGGSVSALVGALGAALTCMVGSLTTEKDADAATLAKVAGTKAEALRLMEELKGAVDKDTEVFNRVMAAYKLPKATDEEKQARTAAIQTALKGAADEPFRAAGLCLEVMKQALVMLKHGNKNAASDAVVSGLLAHAALYGALCNVKINLNFIRDADYGAAMNERTHALTAAGDALLADLKSLEAEIIG